MDWDDICPWMRRKKIPFIIFFLITSFYLYLQSGQPLIPDHEHVVSQLRAEVELLRHQLRQSAAKNEAGGVAPLPTIFVITPTYARPVQIAELTRLGNTFRQVASLHWIVVEDASTPSHLITAFLTAFPQNYTHLAVATPSSMKLKPKDPNWSKPRGVLQRNLALQWLRENVKDSDGVVYFADDDNTYALDLFHEIRSTTRVSVFPVGLVGGVLVEKPKVLDGRVIGWEVGWGTSRQFAVDMAGFAINLRYLLAHPAAEFAREVKIGHQESDFLQRFASLEDLEPRATGRVLVWHTRTEAPLLNAEEKFRKKFGHSSDQGLKLI